VSDKPLIPRARKAVTNARCCWVCGRLGGAGYTTALRLLGYDVPPDGQAHAHPECIRRVQRKQKEEREKEEREKGNT
jgi:hypothetical protein